MCSYNALNGVPTCADKALLTDLARGTWGFDGYITGDCGAAEDVYKTHHYTQNPEEGQSITHCVTSSLLFQNGAKNRDWHPSTLKAGAKHISNP